jgi:hypothetical protein
VWFPEWETFYIVLATASGALTGLMFVVSALFGNIPDTPEDALHAFATPTVFHLANVLLLSLLFVMPWPTVLWLRLAVAVFGVSGSVYMLIVWRRAIRQSSYKPVFEDWLRYMALPLACYTAIFIAAAALRLRQTLSLFAIAGGSVLLLFVGIHNSWDNVVYITVGLKENARKKDAS